MSGDLNITFAAGMPAASVEVLSPDLEVVARIMLSGGRSKTVSVPSEASFLRVHLPSGQSVILKDPGNLSRVITFDSVLEQLGKPARLLPARGLIKDDSGTVPRDFRVPSDKEVLGPIIRKRAPLDKRIKAPQKEVPLLSVAKVRLRTAEDEILWGTASSKKEAKWGIDGNPQRPPFLLEIDRPIGWSLKVVLPGDVQQCRVRVDAKNEKRVLNFCVRLTSGEPVADTVLSYLQRGDFYSAEAMTDWIEEAEEMLLHKKQDAYAAAVGGYLLLRTRNFQHLHRWAKNLADWFPFLPDGCVIWAWQMMRESQGDALEVKKYLLEAARRGLPVYTEGLRLLLDGLRLLGEEARNAYDELARKASFVLWDSPISASILTGKSYLPARDTQQVVCSIKFEARRFGS